MRKIKTMISMFIILNAISVLSSAYDLSYDEQKKTSGHVTVALVPFAEKRTKSLDDILKRFDREIRRLNGVRVMDQDKTQEIVDYYLKYVNEASAENDVQVILTEARQQLLLGQFENVGRILNKAHLIINEKVKRGGSNEGLFQMALLQAKVAHALGDELLVSQSYRLIAHLQPGLELDPNLYSRWERKALKEAKSSFQEGTIGDLMISSKPVGAEVFLNGIHQGVSPLTIKALPSGLHVIEIKTVHHAPYLQQIKIQSGMNTVSAALKRTAVVSSDRYATISPSHYKTDLEVSRLISTLGYHLGVDKVVLVADHQNSAQDTSVFQVGDSALGAVQKQYQTSIDSGSSQRGQEGILYLVSQIGGEVRTDVLSNPNEHANQSVGSLILHQRKRQFYQKPIFWVLVGAGAGGGGALGAILGGSAAATTGGVVIGL